MELGIVDVKNMNDMNLTDDRKSGDNTPISHTNKPNVGILGAGNFGYALALNFKLVDIYFRLGSRTRDKFHMDGFNVLSYEEVAETSAIIFLCIPSHAYETVIDPIKELLVGKIIVDVSNIDKKTDPSNALKLQSMLPKSYVVKALNNISAYHLENIEYGGDKQSYVCGDDDESKRKVMQVLREIGVTPIDRGLLRSAVVLEKLPHRLFPGWGLAIGITIATLIPLWLYYYLHFIWYKQETFHKNVEDLPLYVGNRLIAWLMFWLLGLTYLPGVLAGFIQIFRGTKYRRFPSWLDQWMRCRKQLGLICLLLAGTHGCMSTLVLGAGEAKHMLKQHRIPNTSIVIYQLLKTKDQVSLLFASLALALMSVLGITSLPSVSARMSWKEWNLIQSTLGFVTLVFGFVHVMAYVYKLWDKDYMYGWKMWAKHPRGIFPPAAFVMPMFPLLVIGLRLILMLPGISCYLSNIRKGKIGYKSGRSVKVV